jgi:hypothetical protein
MIETTPLRLAADRWTAFLLTLDFDGADFTGAIFAMHVRLSRDAPGVPLIALGMAASSLVQGVRLISVTGVGAAAVSSIGVRIDEATMRALPGPSNPGADVTWYWDLHVTPTGATKQRYLGGEFIVRAGVTQ